MTGQTAKPLRLAVCTSELGRGGPEGVMLTLLTHLDRSRFEPSLCVGDATGSRRGDVPDDVELHEVGWATDRYPLGGLIRAFRSIRPDVVLATHRMTPVAVAASRAVRPRPRVVVRPANFATLAMSSADDKTAWKHRIADGLSRRLIGRADAIVAQSRAMEQDIRSRLPSRSGPTLVQVNNPIDLDGLNQHTAARRPDDAGDPMLVTVGRLARQKGVDRVIDAFHDVVATSHGARLWIVGDGPEREQLEHQTVRLGLDDSIVFTGHLDDPLGLVAAADLYVTGARWEGLSNALIEAQALGVPAVAFDGPASGDMVIEHGSSGEVIPHLHPERLARGIRTALEMDFDRTTVREVCRERFGIARTVGGYEDLLAGATALARP